jgi:hypothetical protein
LDIDTRSVKVNVLDEPEYDDNGVFKLDKEQAEYLDKDDIFYKGGPKFAED